MLKLRHAQGDRFVLYNDAIALFEYIYKPKVPALQCRRPYFHPLYTLAGKPLTDFQPSDHPWHLGLSLTLTSVNDQNFWGGPTYQKETNSYEQLDNVGRVEHVDWLAIDHSPSLKPAVQMKESLRWITAQDWEWLKETRTIYASLISKTAWMLRLHFELTNITDEVLQIGSPTTAGRPNAGYGGLFWRGHDAFKQGDILAPHNRAGESLMGKQAAWLAFSAYQGTLIFMDSMSNSRYPTQWFVRQSDYVGVSFAFAFDTVYDLPPQETLSLEYRIIIANGKLNRPNIEAYAE